ncbi:tyrosine-protein phosphatase [Bacillus massiliigorillae]|uniref:tyrosine-protein phosphatase n=1 Tax=Bacillus massiliigorillae TaxID=1243664 RepID=UPI00039DC1BE|nr:CpsB/CapC family capsule biosynthesis tyrosine phosphatase [Bacillus massiliigorillae]
MIDLHSHILWGVDDGAKTLEDSLKMAKQAVNQGIRTIVATPHHMNGNYLNTRKDIKTKVSELNNHLEKKQIPLDVLPGQEIRVYGDLLKDYEKGQLVCVNDVTNYLLIELPTFNFTDYYEKILFEIRLQGLIPVIVHPERNRFFLENPHKLYDLVQQGVLTQVTAASLTGHFGRRIKKFSLQIIKANLTHFIASDAHNVSTRDFKMDEAFRVIENHFGIDYTDFFLKNAKLLLQNKEVNQHIPYMIKKRIFHLF